MSDVSAKEAVENAVMGLKEAELASRSGLPPVDKWEPKHKHSIDMRIARDGGWHYQGSEIKRDRLVKLFASILRRDADGSYHLVTPVEQAGIEVEDAPFIAVSMERAGEGRDQVLAFTTNVGDVTVAGEDHGLRFEIDPQTEEPSPYVHVRGDGARALEARLARPVFYELVELGETREEDGESWFGVWSGGVFFRMQRAAELG